MEKVEIKQMPSKEMLEAFVGGVIGGENCVIFNTAEGVFEYTHKPEQPSEIQP